MKTSPIIPRVFPPIPLLALSLITCCAIAVIPVHAQITEDFSAYTVGDNGIDAGTIDSNWLSTWRTASYQVTQSAIIANTNPVNSGNNYYSGSITTNAGATGSISGAQSRAYNADVISSSGASEYTISFDFRAASATVIQRYDIFDSKIRASSSSSSVTTWRVAAFDGRWHASNGTNDLTDINFDFTAGTIYSFSITQDPSVPSWDLTITNGTTAESTTIEDLATRAATWDTDSAPQLGARWLSVAASEIISGASVGTSTQFSIDSIEIRPVITEDFSAYTVGDNGIDTGTIDSNWLSTWRTASYQVTQSAIIANTNPVNSGNNYYSGSITTNAGATGSISGAQSRAYNADVISSSGASEYTISFDFRAASATAIQRYDIFDSKIRASSSASSVTTWRVAAFDGRWHASNGTNDLTDINFDFTTGTIYSFSITQDPSVPSWDLTITNGTTAESITIEDLATRAATWETDSAPQLGARWLSVAASEIISGASVGTSTQFSIDSISISAPALIDINDYIDTRDLQYLRIKCLSENQYLYHADGNSEAQYSSTIESSDRRTHWYIKNSSDGGQYWILNRVSGEALNVESLNGNIQITPLRENFYSYRWKLPVENNCIRIQSAWQTDQYLSLGNTSTSDATYSTLTANASTQKFRLEPVPQGASLPWVTYDEANYTEIGGGADILAATYDHIEIQAEAQDRSSTHLDSTGGYIKWTLNKPADAFTLRYSIADAPAGGGLDSQVSLYINGVFNQKVDITSKQAWVYFDEFMVGYDAPATGRRPAKRFNEARIQFTTALAAKDIIEFRRESGDAAIWIDVLEAETSETVAPANSNEFYDVTNYGAIANDGLDDLTAFLDCIDAAKINNKGVFIPTGAFHLSDQLSLSNVQIMGAGIWNTELHFTNLIVNKGGIIATSSNVTVSDFYMKGPVSSRMQYRALSGYWGSNSMIENIWLEHFSGGMWIADYTYPIESTDGLIVRNCRVRNTFSDGINLLEGTKNSVVENCHIRSTGDDSLATWSSNPYQSVVCKNITFRYNTIVCTYRANGMGIYGGEEHTIHHNMISDTVTGAGMRLSTTFALYGFIFSDIGMVKIYNNTLCRTGTVNGFGNSTAAIIMRTRYGHVQNIHFKEITIESAEQSGIYFDHVSGSSTSGEFSDISFEDINMTDVIYGTFVLSTTRGSCYFKNVNVTLAPDIGISAIRNNSSTFTVTDGGGSSGF